METQKNIVVRITDFIITSNLWIAFAAYVFTLQTALIFSSSTAAAVFFANTNFVTTFTMYNLQRIYQSNQFQNIPKLFWYDKNRKLIFTLILVFNSLYFSTFKLNSVQFKEGLLLYLPAVIISLFYFLPPFSLRKKPYFKIFIISFIWVYTSVFLPLLYTQNNFVWFFNFNTESVFYLLAQFIFIAVICIPFDVRDFENDRQSDVKTLPVHFGIKRAKSVGVFLAVIYILMAQDTKQLFVYLIIGLLCFILLIFSSTYKHRYYFSLLVDGLIILQFVLFNLFAGY